MTAQQPVSDPARKQTAAPTADPGIDRGKVDRWKDVRHRLEYAALLVLVGIVRAVPIDIGQRISAYCWQRIAPRTRRHTRALANLEIAFPELTAHEREAIARASWANLGRVMAETMQIDRIIADPSRLQSPQTEIITRYADKMGPIVGATLHQGNWELSIFPLTQAGAMPAAVYRIVKNPYVDRYLRRQRAQLVPGGLLAQGRDGEGNTGEAQKTARLLLDYLRRGGRLGLVCDLPDGSGIPVPFFGEPARSTPAPAMIARRTGARIFMARCVRIGDATRFRIELKELRVRRTSNIADDIRQTTADLHAQFEAWVRDEPTQYMWANRRWIDLPEGHPARR
ncbi:MAG: lysophospholipid acyltransferase family protein [Pseudomonadota bacterium]